MVVRFAPYGGSVRQFSSPFPSRGIRRRMVEMVKSVVLCNRRLPVNLRYALVATEIARRCNLSRRAQFGSRISYSIAAAGKYPHDEDEAA
jgi:hypothetical protein